MTININPRNLYRHLRHTGPYLFFFNGEKANRRIVEKMRFLSQKHLKLQVLEISWKEQIEYNQNTYKDVMKTIFLYFQRQLKEKKTNPKAKEIEELFELALYFNKINIDAITNQMCGLNKSKLLGKKRSLSKNMKIHLKNNHTVSEGMKNILKNKLNNKNKRKNSENMDFESSLLYETSDNNLKLIDTNTNKYNDFINYYSNKLSLQSEPWFSEVLIGDLPTEIIIEEQPKINLRENSQSSKNLENVKIHYKSSYRVNKYKTPEEKDLNECLNISNKKQSKPQIKDYTKKINSQNKYQSMNIFKSFKKRYNNINKYQKINTIKEYSVPNELSLETENIMRKISFHLIDHNYFQKI